MFETTLIASIVIAAGFLQGLTGFGFVLIALPLLGLFIELKIVIPLVVMLAVFISLTLSIQLRHSIRFKNITLLFLATLPGFPVGAYILKNLSTQPLALSVGALMVSFTAYQLFSSPNRRSLGHSITMLTGFISGTLTTSIGAGGPPVIIYSTIHPWSKDETKATLAFYFFISGTIAVATHAYNGLISSEVLQYFTVSLPALAMGIALGLFSYKRISDHGYRKLAIVLVFVLGCLMIYKNI